MLKLKVLFRKDKTDGDITAFFPEFPANHGNIACYQHIGQHGEASLSYYHETELAKPEEYAELYHELHTIYKDTMELTVRQRLNWNDLTGKSWAWVIDGKQRA